MGGIAKFKKRLESSIDSLEIKKETFRNIITGKIYDIMKISNVNKCELSKKMKVSKASITNLLSGNRNFTIDKITEIAHQMNYTPSIDFLPRKSIDFEMRYCKYYEKRETAEVRVTTSPSNIISTYTKIEKYEKYLELKEVTVNNHDQI